MSVGWACARAGRAKTRRSETGYIYTASAGVRLFVRGKRELPTLSPWPGSGVFSRRCRRARPSPVINARQIPVQGPLTARIQHSPAPAAMSSRTMSVSCLGNRWQLVTVV